uniref:U1-type domain-containing protein n=1 Tax=Romanomermis culicivorax TaxID=13658 RepID=A0A915JHP6_ROMCU
MDAGALPKNGPYPLQCDLCKVTMNGQNQAQLHFEGRRHKEAILHTQGAPNTVMEPEGPYGGMMGPPPPMMMMNDMMPPMAVSGPGMMGPPMGADPYFAGGEYYDNQMMFNTGPPSGPPRGARGRSFINVGRRGRGNSRGGVHRGGRSGFGVRGSPAKRGRGKNGSFQNDDMRQTTPFHTGKLDI